MMCCPACLSKEVVPLVFGYPGTELLLKAEQGLVHLGGCCITEFPTPDRYCRNCELTWYDIRDEATRGAVRATWVAEQEGPCRPVDEKERAAIDRDLKKPPPNLNDLPYRREHGPRFPVLVMRNDRSVAIRRNYQTLVEGESPGKIAYLVDASGYSYDITEPFEARLREEEPQRPDYAFFKELESAANREDFGEYLDRAIKPPDYMVYLLERVTRKRELEEA